MTLLGKAAFACGLLAAMSHASAQEIPFRHVVVDADGPIDPWGKSIGDLNGDQKIDLIVGGRKSGGLVWYQNPSWTKHAIASNGNWSTDHEVVDVDQDGDMDVVSLTIDSLCWYENPSWAEHLIERRVLHDIEVADFDGDGDSDVVGRDQGEFGHSGATLHFYRQDSIREWTHRSIECPDGEGLTTADIDRDKDTDVIINSVWIENTGDIVEGSWTQHSFTASWKHAATFVALEDFNRDGRLDILLAPSELAGQRYRISWFESPHDPTADSWVEHVIARDVEAVHHFAGAADMDLDGDVDVITAEMEQGEDPDEIKIYHNEGDSDTWSKQVIASTGSHSMRIVDFDDDGDLDLFGANWQGHTVDLWVNQIHHAPSRPLNGWTHLVVDQQRASRAFGIGWGDVDQDGDIDIASGQYVYSNPGGDMSGHWRRTTLPGHVDANFITDVDGDRHVDILAQALPDVLWLEATDTTGTSYTAKSVASGLGATGHGSSQGFVLSDLMGSGAPEYVLTTGNGIFCIRIPDDPLTVPWPRVHITSRAPEEGLAAGDVDGDRLNDLVSWIGSGSGSRRLGWWKNPGTSDGNWKSYHIGEVAGAEGDRVAVGDFNHDGKIDVAATGTTNGDRGSSIYWFGNPGQPTSNVQWNRVTIGSNLGAMNSMSVADVDQDGAVDVITGEHRGSKEVVVWRNRKAGTAWSAHVVDIGKESHLGAQVADLDNDGDLDIISIGWDEYRILHVWRNDTPSQTNSRGWNDDNR